MLNRQKIILTLLDSLKKPTSPVVLMKLAFLAHEETLLKSDRTFYDFVPYKYGPFSFALYRELDALIQNGYVSRENDTYSINENARDSMRKSVCGLNNPIKQAAYIIFDKYGSLARQDLIKYVYHRYPWYSINSELKAFKTNDNACIESAAPAIYTIGYEGKSVDALFNVLLQKGIFKLIDVRSNPYSRKYGFAKKTLENIANKLSLSYIHIPELGVPGEDRANLSDYESYQTLLNHYETETLPKREKEIARLVEIMKSCSSAVMCYEDDVNCCHRGRLARAASEFSGLDVVNI